MSKYQVDLAFTNYLTYVVEADSVEDAKDKAWTLYESGVEGDPGYKLDLLFAREHGYHFGRSHYEYKKEEQCSQETATVLS
jgi:hypothetical protein